MNHWFTSADAPIEQAWVKRFDPLHWTIDFPRGAMASLVTGSDSHSLSIETSFLRKNDLVGLIWSSEDLDAHPAHRRETSRDYSGCVLRFRWQSNGLIPLDAVNGPTLTIEGTDEQGNFRGWFVRLWNYAQGSGEDAIVTLDFDALDGGFSLPADADRVDPARIDRMFISLVPPGYDGALSDLLAAPVEGQLTLSEMACDGAGSVLSTGDAMVPDHGLRIATAYDDQYHLPPERVVKMVHALGYRGTINHYVGMSHYMTLGSDGLVDPSQGLCSAALAWHRDFARAAKAYGYELILSLSYEILDQFCPEDWKQRSHDGAPAHTGYDPPSTLVSPASGPGITYLGDIMAELAQLAADASLTPRVQVGEPWWWVTSDHRPCFYDANARDLLGGDPLEIDDVRGGKTPQEIALLDAAGALLASSTQAVASAATGAVPGTVTYLLAYLPGPLGQAMPEMKRANLPVGWSKPAFDVLQLEDYEWVTAGHRALSKAKRAEALSRLGFSAAESHYLSGFAEEGKAVTHWPRIIEAARDAGDEGFNEIFVWALPQVVRDGLTIFGKEKKVNAFEDVEFPIPIGQSASVSPSYSTDVVTSASGHEFRNSNWAEARLHIDAGPGVRSEAELGELIAFFRARRGPATAFRFRDPYDHSSNAMTGAPGPGDQTIGTGDGTAQQFGLVKYYEGAIRRITRPVAGSVRVALDGDELTTGWTLEEGGQISFDQPPGVGVVVSAGYLFDVPVRFEDDRLDINRETFMAGEAVSVPLIEVRDGA